VVIPTISKAVNMLVDAGIRARRGYPAEVMPQITAAVAAVNVKSAEEKTLTLTAAVCAPMSKGAKSCESLAEKVAKTWRDNGAVSSYSECRFDSQSALFILKVQGTWTEPEPEENPAE
jgi:hypothetical protein